MCDFNRLAKLPGSYLTFKLEAVKARLIFYTIILDVYANFIVSEYVGIERSWVVGEFTI